MKVNDRVGILTDTPFLYQNSLGQPGGLHMDTCITTKNHMVLIVGGKMTLN